MGYVIAFVVFIVMMFVRPGGILAKRELSRVRAPSAARPRWSSSLAPLSALRWAAMQQYVLHVA